MIYQDKARLRDYIVVYFLLLFKAGFFFIERGNMITAPLFLSGLLVLSLIQKNGKIDIGWNIITVAISMFVLMNITNVIYGFPAYNEYINVIINIITAIVLVCIISKERFIKAYCDIIYYMGIASLLGWIFMTFFPSIFRIFPALVNTANRIGYFCGLTIVSDFRGASAQRTQGVFWEPGAYQCLVIISMLLEKYQYSPRKKIRRILVNSAAIILSFSTTGYIALMLVWIVLISKNAKHFHAFRTGVFLLLIAFVYLRFGANLSGQLWYTLSFKIEGMLHYKDATNYAVTARAGSVLEPLKLFVSSPIFGIGEEGYNEIVERVGLATCTPVNYLCKYGVLFALVNFYGFYRFIRVKGMRPTELLFIIFTLLVSFFSETFFMNPILLVFMFYGYKTKYVEDEVIEGALLYEL